ncbi:winged helix DNA-binding domain-containing protein [Saccharomonospora sp. NB11]|uniref:winged helix DNA-binding domain-containing protein n=1 Tax=Saccharomonospora sp. NB11 TaxID=1642298 RepID=UPI0018D12962|nr:winged helix DNA-binding domain-containing protein [Saccharomonospora sp. NB11]
MRTISAAQRRALLGRRHRLAPDAAASDPLDVADSLVAMHSTDPTTVYLSTWARTRDCRRTPLEDALYTERSLLRLLAVRRTVFVTPRPLAPLFLRACAADVADRERRTLLTLLAASGVAEPERFLNEARDAALAVLSSRSEIGAADLADADPRLGTSVVLSQGKRYENRQSVASRLLLLLSTEGLVVRGRPRGSWTSQQYQWSSMRTWLGEDLPSIPVAEAEVRLARHWLAAHGPALPEDLQWWTGWTKTRTRTVLTALRPVEVEVHGSTGIDLPDADTEVGECPAPWAALLPALDPTSMGWKHRDWYLGEHAERVFDTTGNAGPTVWWNGHIVGGWSQDGRGDVTYRLLEDIGSDGVAAVDAAAERLTAALAGARLAPRGRRRSPLELEIVA